MQNIPYKTKSERDFLILLSAVLGCKYEDHGSFIRFVPL